LINVLRRVTLFVNGEISLDDLPPEIKGGDPIDMLMKSCSRCFFEEHMSYDQLMTCLETNLLRKALEIHEGNKSRAAKFLGLKPSTFRDKLVKYRLADSR
jgi:DNA-binding NtrC family response regulator